MTRAAVCRKEVGSGGRRIQDVARQSLNVGLAEGAAERRHIEMAAALDDDIAECGLRTLESDGSAMAGRALLIPETLAVGGRQEVEQLALFGGGERVRPLCKVEFDMGLIGRSDLEGIAQLDGVRLNELLCGVALSARAGEDFASARRQDEADHRIDLVGRQVGVPGRHPVVGSGGDNREQIRVRSHVHLGAVAPGAVAHIQRRSAVAGFCYGSRGRRLEQ